MAVPGAARRRSRRTSGSRPPATGLKVAAARGVGAIHDKDGWLGAPGDLRPARTRSEALTLRVWQSLPHDHVGRLAELGLRSRLGDDYLRLGYLKAFMDGTLGSQTAWMLDGSGVCITSGEQLAEVIRAGAEAGWPVAVHAIGDRANREALDAFEATRDAWQPRGLRQRIEHAQCLDPADVPRFAELGVACSVQFSHAPSDRDLAERFWGERLAGTYAFRSLVDSGAVVANGSDAPVEELDPLAGIRAGVLRTIDDRPAWRPDEALTVEQALHASTVAPAWLTGDERRRGKLLPGYLADLVVLDRDPVAIPVDELPDVQVVATMVGGRWVTALHPGTRPWGNHVSPRAPSSRVSAVDACLASRPAKPASGHNRSSAATGNRAGPRSTVATRNAARRTG